ncbi:unnamed protein product [Pelagomonas calceolata]|uniref:Uncharacterized protein n=1 Tax=Pelagomonas calceolata TaxID=35677 RepID=A0A8J2S8D1_9STRA|nr:unnamed protein product [Pelagomonas calceolata]
MHRRAMIPDEIADAAFDGDKDTVVEWLDEHPERVNDTDNAGASFLLLCVDNGIKREEQLELVCYLLSRGADPNQMCLLIDTEDEEFNVEGYMTPFYAICSASNSPLVQHAVASFLSAGADPNLRLRLADSTPEPNTSPLMGAIRSFVASHGGTSWQLPVVVRLLRAGASLDSSFEGELSVDEWIAAEQRQRPEVIEDQVQFQAVITLIRGVRAAGSWKKYCRARAPHREILALRSLAMRGYITPYQRRRTRGAEHKIAIAFVARLGDNGIVWNILSFWRDPDDIEDITLGNGDVVRVYS